MLLVSTQNRNLIRSRIQNPVKTGVNKLRGTVPLCAVSENKGRLSQKSNLICYAMRKATFVILEIILSSWVMHHIFTKGSPDIACVTQFRKYRTP